MKPLNNFRQVSNSVKVALLLEAGYWDPEASAPIEQVKQKEPVMLAAEHVVLFSTLLQWTFSDVSAIIYNPFFLTQLLENADDYEDSQKERIYENMIDCLSKFELSLFPVYGKPSDECTLGHWTVLAVSSNPLSLRYYETLENMHKGCEAKAKNIVELLSI